MSMTVEMKNQLDYLIKQSAGVDDKDASPKEGHGSPQCLKQQLFRNQFNKTQLCRYNFSGKCKSGKFCSFAHGRAELGVAPDLLKTSMCQSWRAGKCDKSPDECKFAHGAQDLRMTPLFEVCLLGNRVPLNSPGAVSADIEHDDVPTTYGLPLSQMSKPTNPTWMSEPSDFDELDIPCVRQPPKLNTTPVSFRGGKTMSTATTGIDPVGSPPPSYTDQDGDWLEAESPPQAPPGRIQKLKNKKISVPEAPHQPQSTRIKPLIMRTEEATPAQHWLTSMSLYVAVAPEHQRDTLFEMLQKAAQEQYTD